MREYEFEPVRGLPERLPPGEEMLWQGAPRWTSLARRAFHVRTVAFYFAVLILWRLLVDWSDGASTVAALQGALWLLLLALIAVGALSLLGWAMSRSTVYTITNRRLVMRIGVALPMMMNLPFKQVRSADLKLHKDGTGDIPLLLAQAARPSYVIFWPHVRPWHFSPAQPMLRAIPDAAKVARILADALQAFANESSETGGDRDDEMVPANSQLASQSDPVS